MDARQMFKFAFISNCIDRGYTTPSQIVSFLKSGADKSAFMGLPGPADVAAGMDAGEGALKGLLGAGKTLGLTALLAPPAIGAAGGYLAGGASDISERDIDDMKHQEVVNEYHRQADRMRREGMLRNYVAPGNRGANPLI